MRDILAGDGVDPWLAVGYLVDSAGVRTPSAWTSRDGIRWSRSTMASTGGSERRDGAYHVARRGEIAVALGARFDGRLLPAAWRSVAGGLWSALTDPLDPVVAGSWSIEALSTSPTGFVAVGVHHTTTQSAIAVFTSADGSGWTVDDQFLTPAGEGFTPLEVVATEDTIVIVGDSAVANADGRIWARKARGEWTRVAPDPIGLAGPDLQQVNAVVRDDTGGFLAGGLITRIGAEVPAVWTSTDGVTWSLLPEDTLKRDSGAAVHELVRADGGYLAAGNSGSGPRLWRSENGRDWSVVPTVPKPHPGGEIVKAAQSRGSILLLVLDEFGSKLSLLRPPDAWKRIDSAPAFPTPDGVAASLNDVAAAWPRAVAVGNDGRGSPLVLRSLGGPWHRMPFNDPAARFQAVTANRGVFTIAGWRLLDGRAYLALWTSKTGRTWKRIGGTRTDPIGAFVDVSPDGRRFLAVALEGTARGLRTTVWGGDRRSWESVADLGTAEARAICVGPGRATAVAVTGDGRRSRILAWRRSQSGQWSREAELVASAADPNRCAEGPAGTVVVGASNLGGAAVSWTRDTVHADRWRATVIGTTVPRTTVNDVIRDGTGFLASGASGARGQVDLALWRSSDGTHWSSYGGPDPVFAELGYQVGTGLVRARERLLVVGRNGAGDGGLWVGR